MSTRTLEAFSDPDNERYLSIVAAWEFHWIQLRGRIGLATPLDVILASAPVVCIDFSFDLHRYSATLPPIHGDPIDRMLIAQALHEDMVLLSCDGPIHPIFSQDTLVIMSTTFTLDTATSRANPTPAPMKRLTVPAIRARKVGGRTADPLVMLTAYTVRMAQLLDPHCDLLLVGDSLGQVIYGLPSTLAVTLDMMCAHGAAVVRGSYHSVVIVDMPFGSYEASPEQAFASASRVIAETGCAGVKLEGGQTMAPTVAFLSARGIPVMAHVGLTPQAVNQLGGYGARGRSQEEHARILDDARAVADAGAFAIVVEGVVEPIASAATYEVDIPIIGIGASAECDGQVLVTEDMMGLFERTPRFVKRYGAMADAVTQAVTAYAADVRTRAFPTPDQTYAGAKVPGG